MTFIENGMDIYRRRDDKSDVTLRKIWRKSLNCQHRHKKFKTQLDFW
jgi:hypothetical protein